MLGLGGELEFRDRPPVGVGEEDDDLGRPGRKVDRYVTGDEQLRLVHVRAAGPDDLVDPLDVREPRDRLRAAERPHLAEPERLGRGRDEPGASGGVVTTSLPTPATCAGTAHMTSVEMSPRGT